MLEGIFSLHVSCKLLWLDHHSRSLLLLTMCCRPVWTEPRSARVVVPLSPCLVFLCMDSFPGLLLCMFSLPKSRSTLWYRVATVSYMKHRTKAISQGQISVDPAELFLIRLKNEPRIGRRSKFPSYTLEEECVGIAFPLTIWKPVESFLDQLLPLYLEQRIWQEPFWADR